MYKARKVDIKSYYMKINLLYTLEIASRPTQWVCTGVNPCHIGFNGAFGVRFPTWVWAGIWTRRAAGLAVSMTEQAPPLSLSLQSFGHREGRNWMLGGVAFGGLAHPPKPQMDSSGGLSHRQSDPMAPPAKTRTYPDKISRDVIIPNDNGRGIPGPASTKPT